MVAYEENEMPDPGTKIVLTPRSLAALIVALVTAAGGGSFLLQRSELPGHGQSERLAVVETKLEMLAQQVAETNRLVRGLDQRKAER